MTLNCVEHLLILASTVTGYVFISIFAYLVGIPVGIENSVVGWDERRNKKSLILHVFYLKTIFLLEHQFF